MRPTSRLPTVAVKNQGGFPIKNVGNDVLGGMFLGGVGEMNVGIGNDVEMAE